LLGNLSDFTPEKQVPYEQLREIDRYLLDRLWHVQSRAVAAYEAL